jgi:integrase
MAKRTRRHRAIYLRADGRWEGQLGLPGGGRKSFYGRTRREALQKLEQGRWSLTLGLAVSSRSKTVAEFLDEWLKVTRRRVRPSTFENYELNARRLKAHFGEVPVSRLSPPAIQHAYHRLHDSGLSDYSVLQAHRTLHRALNQAFHWGLIRANPAALVFPPRPLKREMTALDRDQLLALFEQTRNQPLHALLVLLATSGLRVGEALALRWQDLDLEAHRLYVRRCIRRQRRAGVVFGPPKTQRSRRPVVLTHLAVDALHTYRARRGGGVNEENPSNESELVFTSSLGGPLEPAAPGKALNRALEGAGLPHIRVHDLRHTTASLMLLARVHPKVVQDLLGHTSIRTTLDTYSHAMPVLHEDAVAELDDLLQRPTRGLLTPGARATRVV